MPKKNLSTLFPEQQFKQIVETSSSIRQVIFKLDPSGKMRYSTFYELVHLYKISTAHFTGRGWNKNNRYIIRPLISYLSNQFPISSHNLKLRLIKEKIFEYMCSMCKNTTWLNKPIPLELDHINGNHEDNSLSNIRLLCPNCHATTPTYAGKNIGKTRYKYNFKPAEPVFSARGET